MLDIQWQDKRIICSFSNAWKVCMMDILETIKKKYVRSTSYLIFNQNNIWSNYNVRKKYHRKPSCSIIKKYQFKNREIGLVSQNIHYTCKRIVYGKYL